ncbi:MAG: hypothetical protein J6A75_05410 [Lachnospiraceae bacterium]|nr:hypothetical protein [Lachnospiraceae bacterium]
MSDKKFVLTPKKRTYTKARSEPVRIHKDSYNTLVDMANESTMSMSEIASKAIMFAYEHLSFGDKETEED